MNKKGHGGKRKRSGRKPMDDLDKKETVVLYVVKKDLEKVGGKDAFKQQCMALLK